MKLLITFVTALLAMAACNNASKKEIELTPPSVSVSEQSWGQAVEKQVSLFTLSNANDVAVKITNYGGIITSWTVPDKNNKVASIVLGFSTLEKYLAGHPSFGTLVGRYANRIAKGKFTLNDTTYTLALNNKENHIHGGIKGFAKQVWDAKTDTTGGSANLRLHYISVDGEEGYPGNVDVTVVYSLTKENELIIKYAASTDKPTPINLTNHTYFNLTGDHTQTVLDHTLVIHAEQYTPADEGLIPTGEFKDVEGTPLDFRQPMKVGARMEEMVAKGPGGYDHNFVLQTDSHQLMLAAILYDSTSGRKIETYTTEPGVQLYTANNLNGSVSDESGVAFNKYTGICLETQHFPDSPNKPQFPSTILEPGKPFHSITKYVFSLGK